MQTVGAQWLLVGLPNAATLVALVQTADTLPDVLLAFPAGALADAFDRRRLLIILQLVQVVIGTALTALTISGHMNPPLLLAFPFALGGASAMALPPYQALIPELVPRDQLAAASALGGISINLARAVGPAIAGLLIARVGVGAVFALNTATFLILIAVLTVWRRPIEAAGQAPERFLPALRAGARYVKYSPVVRRILLRLALFVAPATAVSPVSRSSSGNSRRPRAKYSCARAPCCRWWPDNCLAWEPEDTVYCSAPWVAAPWPGLWRFPR